MQLTSIQPFIPSGSDFKRSKELFVELGFSINWDAGDYVGFERDNCKFILQNFNDKHFAENLMMSVTVSDLDEFWEELTNKQLPEKFGIRLGKPTIVPWGREVNMIDIAGVCWHFTAE